jgi:hypothetical protein
MHNTTPKAQWEKVYEEKAPEAVSWYQPHLDTSLALIERTGAGHDSEHSQKQLLFLRD